MYSFTRHYRREVLRAVKADLREELAYMTDIILDEPKNYQVWYVMGGEGRGGGRGEGGGRGKII